MSSSYRKNLEAASDLFDELYDVLPWDLYAWFLGTLDVLERNLRVQ